MAVGAVQVAVRAAVRVAQVAARAAQAAVKRWSAVAATIRSHAKLLSRVSLATTVMTPTQAAMGMTP